MSRQTEFEGVVKGFQEKAFHNIILDKNAQVVAGPFPDNYPGDDQLAQGAAAMLTGQTSRQHVAHKLGSDEEFEMLDAKGKRQRYRHKTTPQHKIVKIKTP